MVSEKTEVGLALQTPSRDFGRTSSRAVAKHWRPATQSARKQARRLTKEESNVDFLEGPWVQHILSSYGYAAIFLIVMLESAGVPLPGETILISAAVFSGNRHSL
jgi:hypothetical protein